MLVLSSIVYALIVVVVGLLSLTLVTGAPLSKTFRDTQMMGVFFVTGILLALASWLVILAHMCSECLNDKDSCTCYH